jgi:AraC-like DNA-binding protein
MVVADTFAYHVTVHALEARAGMAPVTRFALVLHHALSGHLHYSRAFEAARQSERDGATPGQIESSVAQWIDTDLNPAVQTVKCVRSAAEVVTGFNAYNRSARLAIRTSVREGAHGDSAAQSRNGSATRVLTGVEVDPEASRFAAFAILDELIRCAERNGREGRDAHPRSVSEVARILGAEHSAASEVCAVFESQGSMRIGRLAKQLGCGQRTLERRLRIEGVTAESLRSATRLVRATARLKSADSLTDIAIDEGYSDLAHMSRSFQASCGMAPTLLRQFHRGILPA